MSPVITPSFVEGATYSRVKDIHENFEGQRQGGIITPAKFPLIFLITGKEGAAIGYQDEWIDEDTFLYFGAGQDGDMEFIGLNKAVRDHIENNEQLYLFEKIGGKGIVYLGEFVCEGYEWRKAPDRNGKMRQAIAFRLTRGRAENEDEKAVEEAERQQSGLSLEDLREIAIRGASASQPKKGTPRTNYERSAAIRTYVRKRADGRCEGCEAEAPFLDKKGKPYLEPHHARRISDGGPDLPGNVIALCPTCHRRVHSGADGDAFNRSLIQKLKRLEHS